MKRILIKTNFFQSETYKFPFSMNRDSIFSIEDELDLDYINFFLVCDCLDLEYVNQDCIFFPTNIRSLKNWTIF